MQVNSVSASNYGVQRKVQYNNAPNFGMAMKAGIDVYEGQRRYHQQGLDIAKEKAEAKAERKGLTTLQKQALKKKAIDKYEGKALEDIELTIKAMSDRFTSTNGAEVDIMVHAEYVDKKGRNLGLVDVVFDQDGQAVGFASEATNRRLRPGQSIESALVYVNSRTRAPLTYKDSDEPAIYNGPADKLGVRYIGAVYERDKNRPYQLRIVENGTPVTIRPETSTIFKSPAHVRSKFFKAVDKYVVAESAKKNAEENGKMQQQLLSTQEEVGEAQLLLAEKTARYTIDQAMKNHRNLNP